MQQINENYGLVKGCIQVINPYKIYKITKSGKKVEMFKVKCNLCGKEYVIEKFGLLRKDSVYKNCKSCFENLKPGDKVGRLTLIDKFPKIVGNNGLVNIYWNCKCDCGNSTQVSNSVLRKGKVYSCGKCKDIFRPTNSEHYDRVRNIIRRCTNINSIDYPRYGGRGIKNLLGNTIEEMIHSLEKIPGYKPELQLDRIDNDGHYTIEHPIYGTNIWIDEYGNQCLGNLRWVDAHLNSMNRNERKDLSRDLIIKLFNNFNDIDELREFFCGTYLFNYLYMFIFIPDDEIFTNSFRMVISPQYLHLFKRFITDEDQKVYLDFISEYVEDYSYEYNKTLEIVQRLFL